MAGVGEAAAVVGLISTAAKLSKAVIDVASKYKDARQQIESFGREVGFLGRTLDQLYRLFLRDQGRMSLEIRMLTGDILDECSNFFSQLDAFNDGLYGKAGTAVPPGLRGKTKWVFDSKDLDYLRARVDSMKVNILLMMTLQSAHGSESSSTPSSNTQQEERIQLLARQSDSYIRRIQTFEDYFWSLESDDACASSGQSFRTMATAASYQSARESILSSYGRSPYANDLLSASEESFETVRETHDPCPDAATAIEAYLLQDVKPSRSAPAAREDDEPRPNTPAGQTSSSDDHRGSLLPMQYILCIEDAGPPLLLSSIHTLRYLMARIYELETSGATNEYRLCHYFDCISGEGSGGGLAIMLGSLRMDVTTCANVLSSINSYDYSLSHLFSPSGTSLAITSMLAESLNHYNSPSCLQVPFGSDFSRCQTVVFVPVMCKESSRDSQAYREQATARFKSYGRAGTTSVASIFAATMYGSDNVDLVGNDVSTALDACGDDISVNPSTYIFSWGHRNPTRMAYHEIMKCDGKPPRLVVSFSTNYSLRTGLSRSWRSGFRQSSHSSNFREAVEEESKIRKDIQQDTAYYRFRPDLGTLFAMGAGRYPVVIHRTNEYLAKPEIKQQMLDLAKALVARRQARAKEPGWAQYAGLDTDGDGPQSRNSLSTDE